MDNVVFVRKISDSEMVSIIISWNGKALNLSRNKTEALKQSLSRIRIKLNLATSDTLCVEGASSDPISDETCLDECFVECNVLKLGSQILPILVNMPRVNALSFGLYPLVNCKIIPLVDLEYSDDSLTSWKWERLDLTSNTRTVVGTDKCYTPTLEDVGYSLSVECTPRGLNSSGVHRVGLPVAFQLMPPPAPKKKSTKGAGAVAPQDISKPIRTADVSISPYYVSQYHLHDEVRSRCAGTRSVVDETSPLRVVSYNILLDAFCDNKWALENVYPYVQSPYANIHIRKQVVAMELLAYDADIICLQEVEFSLFSEYFSVHLNMAGYKGVYANKISQNQIGSAVFVKEARISIVSSTCLDLTDCWRHDARIHGLLAGYPNILARFQRTTTVSQCIVLRMNSDDASSSIAGEFSVTNTNTISASLSMLPKKSFVVINGHLFSNPQAAHFRTLQAALTLNYVTRTYPELPVILCADLNADRDSGVFTYLIRGELLSSHPEWAEGLAFEELESDTQEERQSNWHLVMGDSDVRIARLIFTLADSSQSGLISWKQLSSLLFPSVDEVTNTSTVVVDSDELSTIRDVLASGMLSDNAQQITYAQLFVGLSKMKQQLTNSYMKIIFDVFVPRVSSSSSSSCCVGGSDNDLASLASLICVPHAEECLEGSMASVTALAPYPMISLNHNITFEAACEDATVTFFAGKHPSTSRLDHLLFDSHAFKLTTRYDQPRAISVQAILDSGGLPSAQFPSDHVSIIADLEWF